MVPVEILGIQLANDNLTPVVLLREAAEPHRIVPVVIGSSEAMAIAMGLEGVAAQRPLTHDLLVDVLAQTNTTVDQVTITEVRDGAFVAELALGGPAGDRVVDSRPSDAIAIAVRVHAPLFMAEEVLESAGVRLEAEPPVDAEELVDEFRSFLDEVDPSAFDLRPAPAEAADPAELDPVDLEVIDAQWIDAEPVEPERFDAGVVDAEPAEGDGERPAAG